MLLLSATSCYPLKNIEKNSSFEQRENGCGAADPLQHASFGSRTLLARPGAGGKGLLNSLVSVSCSMWNG